MNEDFLIYLWTYQLIDLNLKTTDEEDVAVQKPGLRNTNSGPDFFNGKVKIGDTTWAGNIEIHIYSSDWHKHQHQLDPAYDNIILHVVYQDDKPVIRKNNEKIPTIELKGKFNDSILSEYKRFLASEKWIPCEDMFHQVSIFDKLAWLDKLMAERLEQKATSILEELQHSKLNFQEVFYRKLARNFGFHTNADTFERLAVSLLFKILSKHKSSLFQLETLLYGQAGFLEKQFKDEYPNQLRQEYVFLANKYSLMPIDKKLWKFMRLRPTNFPTIRISQFAQLLFKSSALISQILETSKLSSVTQLLKVGASEYWINHYRFDVQSPTRKKTLGAASINLIMINTVIPFLFVYGNIKNDPSLQNKALAWLEKLPPEQNNITRRFSELDLKPGNTMQSQALLQLKTHYCDQKRCLHCRIGHKLLSKG